MIAEQYLAADRSRSGEAVRRTPILVTGSHRSGTTWVGRMISASPFAGYIHEPFNPHRNRGTCALELDHWFTYVSEHNERTFYGPLRDTLEFCYGLRRAARTSGGAREWPHVVYEALTWWRYRRRAVRPVMKDPIAVLSAEWLASAFNMDVVMMIRHPAAFASSLKMHGWRYPFAHFLEQPQLMSRHLHRFEREIRESTRTDLAPVEQAALLWKLIYSVVARYREGHPDWLFVKHENISRDPAAGFREIYDHVGLTFTTSIERTVRKHSSPANPTDPGASGLIRRDSRSGIRNWKRRLSTGEVETVRRRVEPVSALFYSDEEW